ncbi:hypothetical protein V6Z11_A04G135400 [Gossypium hirsutum]
MYCSFFFYETLAILRIQKTQYRKQSKIREGDFFPPFNPLFFLPISIDFFIIYIRKKKAKKQKKEEKLESPLVSPQWKLSGDLGFVSKTHESSWFNEALIDHSMGQKERQESSRLGDHRSVEY